MNSKQEMKREEIAALGAEAKKGKKKSKKEPKGPKVNPSDAEGFDPVKWDGVTLKLDAKVYVIIERDADDPLAFEQPRKWVEGELLGFFKSDKEGYFDTPVKGWTSYAFDTGQFKRRSFFHVIKIEDREHNIYPHTPEGLKRAKAWVDDQTASRKELVSAARDKNDEVCRECASAESTTLEELEVMAIALGGTPETLVKVGKSRPRKIEAIMKLRPAYFEKAGKK